MKIQYTLSISILFTAALLSIWMSRVTSAFGPAERVVISPPAPEERIDGDCWRRIKSEPDLYSAACRVIDIADEILLCHEHDGAPGSGAPSCHSESRNWRITYLALAYRLTGDARYSQEIWGCIGLGQGAQ
jgi:hypothetical protein